MFDHYDQYGNDVYDLTHDDWTTLIVVVVIGTSMLMGIGEAVFSIGGVGFDLYEFWQENHEFEHGGVW